MKKNLDVIPKLKTLPYDNVLCPVVQVNKLVFMARKPCGRMQELYAQSLQAELIVFTEVE